MCLNVHLINTPKKISNKNYSSYKNKPIEISLRNTLGNLYDIENIDEIAEEILALKNNINPYEDLRRELKELNNLKKIESLEKKLINNLDENSYSELIKLKSQINGE